MLAMSGVDAAVTVGLLMGAAVCEVIGGWCIWKWRREAWPWWVFVIGAAVLLTSGILPTLQKQEFSRTYAVYGGFFISVSYLWGWALDGHVPDIWDGIGAAIAVVGVCVCMFVPRKATPALPQ